MKAQNTTGGLNVDSPLFCLRSKETLDQSDLEGSTIEWYILELYRSIVRSSFTEGGIFFRVWQPSQVAIYASFSGSWTSFFRIRVSRERECAVAVVAGGKKRIFHASGTPIHARPLLAPTETTQTFHWANVWFRRSDFTSGIVPPLRIRNHYRRESGRRIVEKDGRGKDRDKKWRRTNLRG